MGCLPLLIILLIAAPIIFYLFYLNIVTFSFSELGLSPGAAIALLLVTLMGSMINIPVSRRQVELEEPQSFYSRFFFYIPPRVREQVVAVNVGGAIIPVAFALYLSPRAPIIPTLAATGALILVTRALARVVPGVGIVMPVWIPPLLSAALALLLARDNPAPVAYISGTVGTLVGADLLNWPNFRKLGAHLISIGGAGVFDGVFLTGVVAALITTF